MVEYAILEAGEIINVVVTTSRDRDLAIARAMEVQGDLTVVPLDSLPEDVKRRYRYWNERP